MNDTIKILAALLIGYLLGSLNTSVIVGKITGKDIRSSGSGNAGLANAVRVFGKNGAFFVFAGDILKGVLACAAGLLIGVYYSVGAERECVSLLAAGIGAVTGHNWPVYFKFKGGKGVLTAVSVLFMADWRIAFISVCVYLLLLSLTRYSSLGSVCAMITGTVLSFVPVFGGTIYFYIFMCLTAAVIIYCHRENIKRLIAGTETKMVY